MKGVFCTLIVVILLLGLGGLAAVARGKSSGGASADVIGTSPALAAAASDAGQAQAVSPAGASVPAAGSVKYNWIALPLHDASLEMASDLQAHIEANSSGTITVAAVQQWDATIQDYRTYSVLLNPDGDFALAVGGVYRVSVTGNGGAQVIWSMAGDVPDPSQFSYTLRETATSDHNWIMLPLQKDAITMASQLKADIEANSHPSVTISTVQQWNAVAQNWQTYSAVPFPDGDFPVRIGYPYRVTVTAASPGTWP